jgi:threonine/homoserine/homoserine lactone efflux protein
VWGHKEVEYFLKLRGIDFPEFNPLSVNLFNVKRFFFYLALFFLVIRVGLEVKWRGYTRILLILLLVGDLFGNMAMGKIPGLLK